VRLISFTVKLEVLRKTKYVRQFRVDKDFDWHTRKIRKGLFPKELGKGMELF
jgi:hypothetical protein